MPTGASPTGPDASDAPTTEPSESTGETVPSAPGASTPLPESSTDSPTDSPTGRTDPIDVPPPPPGGYATLREAGAAVSKLIGVAIAAGPLGSDATYRDIAAQQFDYVTPEDAMKWGPLQPTSAANDWTDADAIVDFAANSEQAVKGHTFVWYQQNPSWLTDAVNATDLGNLLQSHIRETVRRYNGKVRAWDIVNEAIDTDSPTGYRENNLLRKARQRLHRERVSLGAFNRTSRRTATPQRAICART